MSESIYYRHAEKPIQKALKNSPAVLLQGPRQCGKTTLTKIFGSKNGYEYLTFDTPSTLKFAEDDPEKFVEQLPQLVILDEIQRVPEILLPIKEEIDNNRQNGRFILTGSSNIYDSPKTLDSLAGRISPISLHPLSQCEILDKAPKFLDAAFSHSFKSSLGDKDKNLEKRIVTGGFPLSVKKSTEEERAEWYEDYIKTLLTKDLPSILKPHSLEDFLSVLRLVAAETGSLFNVARLSRDLAIPKSTSDGYLKALGTLFMTNSLSTLAGERTRLRKAKKLHICDTGLACSLLNIDTADLKKEETRTLLGGLFETFVLQELVRQSSSSPRDYEFRYYGEQKNGTKTLPREVDIVINKRGETVGVEVKLSGGGNKSDFAGLRRLRKKIGESFKCGIVIHQGGISRPFFDEEEKMFALPVQALWDTENYTN